MYTSSNVQNIFSYRGATLCNSFAIGVKQAPSHSVFKKRPVLSLVFIHRNSSAIIAAIELPVDRGSSR